MSMNCHLMKMICSRLFSRLVFNIKANMSTNSKSKNHYETLQLKESATHNEIKSAYYKLTMQYHPDKNKTDLAKEKFRDVTEAYEVLGNRNSRMSYDRKITVRNTGLSPRKGPIIVKPPTMNIYKTVRGTFNDPLTDTAYNDDEWIKSHYRKRFKQRQQAKAKMNFIDEEEEVDDPSKGALLLCSTVVILMFIAIFYAKANNYYDEPAELSKTKSSFKNTENENNTLINKKRL